MSHLHAHMADPSGSCAPGHTLTASACLISQSSSPVSAPSSWATSYAVIERLFHLSSSLNLCGEITPVEAWNRIWLHPLAGGLTAEGLATLEGNLKGLITCYGYILAPSLLPLSPCFLFYSLYSIKISCPHKVSLAARAGTVLTSLQ
jgi:hypothetical protein